jgi:cold-inducible RNA-binding protein
LINLSEIRRQCFREVMLFTEPDHSTPGELQMEYKLYVGNLSYTTSETDLQTLFAEAGAVKSVALIKDRDSGRSKGFAFVEMENQKDMQNAISMFNGKEFQDRALAVSAARPREERSGGGFGGGGGYGGKSRGGGGGGYNSDRGRNNKSGGQKRSW